MTEPSYNTLVQELIDRRRIETEADAEAFDSILARIKLEDAERHPDPLYLAFDDDTGFPQVTFNLLHLVEDLDLDTHVRTLAKMGPQVETHARGWLEDMVFRVVNDDRGVQLLRSCLEQPNPVLRDVLEVVSAEGSPDQQVRVRAILG